MTTDSTEMPVPDLLSRLVGFDTVSHRPNIEMARYIEELVRPHGAVVRHVPSPDGAKTNLLVSFGPMGPGGIVLSGHMDVVPV